ncbi:hypothetical protein GH714_038058 [Hevea brasiliensis]|uniref:Pectinesterase n=1 Tax=Hevea brasiliensis TaxID=3981 RepID=A0A6A6KDW8_HEVBR|nr:hypothetical protein GH714_038058 [Hevea brasiliensis]
MAIIFNNSSSPSKNSTRTRQKTAVLLVFFTLTTLLLASFFRESFLGSKGQEGSTDPASATPIPHPIVSSACSRTFYPSLCFTTLSSIPASKNSITFLYILESTMDAVEKSVTSARTHVLGLFTFQDLISQEENALKDCVEMLDQTLYELGLAMDDLHDFSAPIRHLPLLYANIKTLLSAAMTNQNTCIDGFSDLDESAFENHKDLKVKLHRLFTPVTRMISNCLSIVTYMDAINESGIFNDQQMFVKKILPNRIPAWMTSSDRILMERRRNMRPNITVASDGSGDYRLISEAIKMAPKRSRHRFVIKIKAGVYDETVEISREKINIMLIGDGMTKTIIRGSKNFVDGFSTFDSATLTVTGDKFLARDLTIMNTAGPHKYQAVAARVTSNSAFYRCNFSSYQDTLFAHSLRQFYRECTIQGTIDFIFGNAAAIFQNCLILVRKPIPGQSNMITAQGRRDPNQNTGFSLQNCTILAAADLKAAKRQHISTFLGRPWGNYSRTMVMKSYLGDLIHPQGWYKWDNYSTLDTVEYIEHLNYGPGSNTRHRVTWGGYNKNCSEDIARQFTVGKFLHEADHWLESTGFPLFTGS